MSKPSSTYAMVPRLPAEGRYFDGATTQEEVVISKAEVAGAEQGSPRDGNGEGSAKECASNSTCLNAHSTVGSRLDRLRGGLSASGTLAHRLAQSGEPDADATLRYS